jgi:hypothetical protein
MLGVARPMVPADAATMRRTAPDCARSNAVAANAPDTVWYSLRTIKETAYIETVSVA